MQLQFHPLILEVHLFVSVVFSCFYFKEIVKSSLDLNLCYVK